MCFFCAPLVGKCTGEDIFTKQDNKLIFWGLSVCASVSQMVLEHCWGKRRSGGKALHKF